jgi:hypothetical protein
MFDFGSIMGSGSTIAQVPRAGNEYILEWGPALKTLVTLGLFVRPWITVDYWQGAKSVGRFESNFFDPAAWRPEYPNPAFDNMRADDAFWGARLVGRFSEDAIRAVVAKAQYSEPGAADHIVTTLLNRREKVLRAWLTAVNPLVEPRLASDGTLTFENAAVSAGTASPAAAYELTWSAFDNTAGTPVGESYDMRVAIPRAEAPPALLNGEFVRVSVRTEHANHPAWQAPATFTFRRSGRDWLTVGLERQVPEHPGR